MTDENMSEFNQFTSMNQTSNVIFPKPPIHLVPSYSSLPCSRADSVNSGCSDESTSEDDKLLVTSKRIDVSRFLPPIGVFWDIENCHVPKGRSAVAVAQTIRDRFFDGYREAEFVVVCDVTKESSRIVQELNDAQVNLIHVAATCKNAADEKLRQSIRRFADIHSAPAAIILISGDVNFAGDLNDLRHRKKLHVILLHNVNVSEALVLCASEHYNFLELVENVPFRGAIKNGNTIVEVIVSNLPEEKEPAKVKNRLKQLCENSGGRVGFISRTMCSIRFPAMEFATRAQKRMDGEDVFGCKIAVSDPVRVEDWNYQTGRNRRNQTKDDMDTSHRINRKSKEDSTFQFNDFYSQKQPGQFPNGGGGGGGDMPRQQNLDSSFQHQLSKNMVPFFSNNISNFTFPKVPNIENLKVIQNQTSPGQKSSYINNLESQCGMSSEHEHRKGGLENKKFNNVIGNPLDGSNLRLNNSTNNCDIGVNSALDNNQLFIAQAQQLQLLAQNALVQRNLAQTAALAQQLAANQLSRTANSGNVEASAGGRGARGNNQNLNRSTPYQEEDCESSMSVDPYFEPIHKPRSQECSSPVDLHISGLDPYMDLMATKNLLTNIFKMHVGVLSVSVFCLTDGSVVASVKVPSFQDAQYAISQLQRRQIGTRRITIAFQNSTKYLRQLVRSQVAQLLSEMPQNKMPLFRFTELFKSRFLNSVSVSELNKMKDICVITEEENGRMISANTRSLSTTLQKTEIKDAPSPYCLLHSHKTLTDSEPPVLPTVRISLKILTSRIRILLEGHDGKLPLPSLADCYHSQFGPLPVDSQGVPLEHLVSCIQGVDVVQNQGTFKYLTWSQSAGQNEDHAKCVSPMLVGTMSVFTRELLELLKDTPKCLLPFSQFIPSYHRRYGRQCRVSDYGYTKLLDLLESLPHVLQVIGTGSYKIVTLSHKAQVRRFTSDLMRVLKSQPNKQIDLEDFPVQYEKVTGRPWDPCHYGLCELEDLLSCSPQSSIIVETRDDGHTWVSIPKREQTPEEMELTKKFAQEVVELLKRVPNCSMAFNKFVPAYHNQFGRQCRVSSYGCFKLIELFEAIPDTVVIEEDSSRGEKYVILTVAKKAQVFAERVTDILSGEKGSMLLNRLEFAYQFYQYDSIVSPADCECDTFEQLLMKIPEYVKIEQTRNGPVVILKSEMDPICLTYRVRFILLSNEKLPVSQFIKSYAEHYQHSVDVETIVNKIPDVVKIVKRNSSESMIQLTPISVFANQMYSLLYDHRGRIPLPNFESAYLNKFKKPCQASQFGYQTLSSLLQAIPETVSVQNNGYYTHKRIVALNTDLKNAGFPMPLLNNESSSSSSRNSQDSSDFPVEKSPKPYDLWQSNSLFPCWNDLNGFVPENITAPHPSELPLPSSKLVSSPMHKILQNENDCKNEVEATSTTDEHAPEDLESEDGKLTGNKRKSRIAAQFDMK